MNTPIQEIKSFIAENRTSDALSRLLELSQSNKLIHDSILLVLAEFSELKAQQVRGTISNEEATLRQNKINARALVALESFDSRGKVLPGVTLPRKMSPIIILFLITLVLSGMAGIAEFFLPGISIMFAVPASFAFLAFLLALVISSFRGK